MCNWSRDERSILNDARTFGQRYDEVEYYELRRDRFRESIRRIGSRPTGHEIAFLYYIGQNLRLDEGDILNIMEYILDLDESDICQWIF